MRPTTLPLYAILLLGTACDTPAQASRLPLPDCEWCGAAEAPAGLSSTMMIAPAAEPGRRLIIEGVVRGPDGRTPVAGVLVYAYHTNAAGAYPKRGDESGNARRHGYLRGWLRTDAAGRYRIETIRPEAYPTRKEAAHVHLTLTPPGGRERWATILFAGDPLITAAQREASQRGPNEIMSVTDSAGVLRGRHDIRLEASPGDTLAIDPSRSVIRWKGTKFSGRGKHEGIVRLSGGEIARCGDTVCGGVFTIDMRSIAVTDIPAHDPVPSKRLTEHLLSDDFFGVARHPTARFRLVEARRSGGDRYAVTGELTLKGVTRPITFTATTRDLAGARAGIVAELTIDRRAWGITYRFDPIRNLLVDDEITIGLALVTATTISNGSLNY